MTLPFLCATHPAFLVFWSSVLAGIVGYGLAHWRARRRLHEAEQHAQEQYDLGFMVAANGTREQLNAILARRATVLAPKRLRARAVARLDEGRRGWWDDRLTGTDEYGRFA